MKEYPDYKVIGNPKITYNEGCTYNINFNAYIFRSIPVHFPAAY